MKLRSTLSLSPRKLLQRHIPVGGTVLDVGCGDFTKTYEYVHSIRPDIEVIGVEKFIDKSIYGENSIPEHITETGKFRMIACDLEQTPIPLPVGSVSGAYCSHVLEHVVVPERILSEIYRVLAPGAWAYIEVPGPRSLVLDRGSWLSQLVDQFPINHWDDETHVQPPFSLERLTQLLQAVGFEVGQAGFHREFGWFGAPAYLSAFLTGLCLRKKGRLKSLLIGWGWWNLVGWPLYVLVRKR